MENLWAPWRMEYVKNPNKNNESCIFCLDTDTTNDLNNLIIKRGKSAFVVMNKYPYNNGHLMISSNIHTSEFDKLSKNTQIEMMELVSQSMKILKKTLQPDGFNFGANFGTAAGAGIKDHLHLHIVPRWDGDTNFMPAIGNTKVQVLSLIEMCELLSKKFSKY